MDDTKAPGASGTDFIRQIVAADVESGRYGGEVVTRFPPEPNGYLHVGHAKSLCLNFGIAEEFGGRCHLRYDDTNPEGETEEFVRAIQEDIRWLGFDWGEHLYHASDYFERMYAFAERLIEKGLAYVDSQSGDEIRAGRGTVTAPGVPGPYRDRAPEENLDLFRRMRVGEFEDGAHVLRAKIDLASKNMLMRDPVLYRIRHAHHFRQGDDWCVYPLYDYAHCLEDAIEGVTHSLCTLEFENNRELYDWVLDNVGFEEPRSHQYEFARLELEHAVLSKRKIIPLVEAGVVSGWDDPRLSTIRGLRRRGIPPEAIRSFCDMIGVAKTNSLVDIGKLEFAIRDVLNTSAPRVMAVLDPLEVVITNYPEGASELLEAPYYPHDVPKEGTREVPFSRVLYIERADFAKEPPKGFRRLVPGGEVRLRYGYVIRCDEVVEDDDGRLVRLLCSYDPETRGGDTPDGRKVKGTVQWVSAADALDAEVRLYDRLFLDAEVGDPDGASDIIRSVNPESLVVVRGAKIEPSVATDPPDLRYQFERIGYFWRDPVDGVGDALVFNRIVTLKDGWARKAATGPKTGAAEPRPASPPASGPAPGEKPQVSQARRAARAEDPELAARYERYTSELGISAEHADLLTATRETGVFFERALTEHGDAPAVAAWMVTDLRGLLDGRRLEELPFGGEELGRLVRLVDEGAVSRRAAKDVLARMAADGGVPEDIVRELGLAKVSDAGALGEIVEGVLAEWPDKVEAYRAGKRNLLGLFVGEVMKASGGAADPKAAKTMIQERLDR
jgi:glutaminyl-tRNA synthetase